MERLWAVWRLVRDVALFTTGLGLVVHEAVFQSGPVDYGLLVVYGGMMGLPAFFRSDERRAPAETTVTAEREA